MDLFHYLTFLKIVFLTDKLIYLNIVYVENKSFLCDHTSFQYYTSFEAFLIFRVTKNKYEGHLQSSIETTAKSMENRNKEVDNTKGISSTSSIEFILVETSLSNGIVGFRFRKIFSKWSRTL